MKNAQKLQKFFLEGQKSLFDIFQTEKSEEKITTLRMLLFSVTVVRRVMEIIALAVSQKAVKLIVKTESNRFPSPF